MRRLAAAEPFTSRAFFERRGDPADLERVADLRRRFPPELAERRPRFFAARRRPFEPFRAPPKVCCISNACAPVTSPGISKRVLSAMYHVPFPIFGIGS